MPSVFSGKQSPHYNVPEKVTVVTSRGADKAVTRVSIITTSRHNVGDDFVREGILYLLQKHYGSIRASCIHKHPPITSRPEFAWIYGRKWDAWLDNCHDSLALRTTSVVDQLLPLFPWSDRILQCDVLVQSGAPVYWTHPTTDCRDNEWWTPLIQRRWLKMGSGRPFFNLAGGTCQSWGSDGSEFGEQPATLEYIRVQRVQSTT